MSRASRFNKFSIPRFSHSHVMFSFQTVRMQYSIINIVLVRFGFGLWLVRLDNCHGKVAVGRIVMPKTWLDTLLPVASSPKMFWYFLISLISGTC